MKDSTVFIAKATTHMEWKDGDEFTPEKNKNICVSTSMDTVINKAIEHTSKEYDSHFTTDLSVLYSKCKIEAWCDGRLIGDVMLIKNGYIVAIEEPIWF